MTWDTQQILTAAGLIFAGFVVSLLVVIAVLISVPADYFHDRPRRSLWFDRHPAARVAMHLLKNALGVCLVLLGIALSLPLVPGQGLLTILIGLMLLDFPGKKELERKIVRRPRVLSTINRLRAKFSRPPLDLPEEPAAKDSGSDSS